MFFLPDVHSAWIFTSSSWPFSFKMERCTCLLNEPVKSGTPSSPTLMHVAVTERYISHHLWISYYCSCSNAWHSCSHYYTLYVEWSCLLPCLQLAFKWFDKGMADLERESQVFMFNSRVLKVDPSVLDSAGYSCLRNFFETINLSERKLRRMSGTLNLVSACY